ncbi:MAG: dihydrofolate reductase [Prevotella sp.]|jgi:dihydrofolate reductase|nr:dihydrofolate reductase [Prevotella sp.]MCH3970112.1 dihydrofolate reductase [Prevotella sp.]MCH4016876.1 dihydrofolate reductase [Prevotella sp.]MCH4099083.1 dihydrofolate reductase [Prevotella sp.]MCI1323756.1 dihydrofolate reductase [Prevotella sp.]MCI1349827.1 dihydrofolate reductase [Prevotella sp.]
MRINIIANVAGNRAIGYHNRLIYPIHEDMRRFKNLTTGHTVIMGRKTFESLPKGALPHRRNIVLSTTVTSLPGCEVYPSLDEALLHCTESEDIYIIGGASVYKQSIRKADRLCLTEVDATPEHADAFFPPYDNWQVKSREHHPADENHPEAYSFVDYIRR